MDLRSNPRRAVVSLPCALLLASAPPLLLPLATDWYVDVNAPGCATGTGTEADPFCTIMDAVAAAVDGDTIHIAPGTYFENLVLLGKDLSLIGTDGQSVTTIDGSGVDRVLFVDGGRVTLRGLTLTHGFAECSGGSFCLGMGGGVLNYGELSLIETTVRDNAAYGWGSGVFSRHGLLTLTDSTVTGNTYTPRGYLFGTGIVALNDLVLERSTVADNGDLGVLGEAVTLISQSTVSNHSWGGISAGDRYVGFGSLGSLTVIDSRIHGNGNGISVSPDDPMVLTLSNSTITGNSGIGVKSGYSVFSYFYPVDADITNCTITGNGGGGLLVVGSPSDPGHATVANCILRDNSPFAITLFGTGATVEVSYSLVEGGWPGTGNLDGDPLFVDPLNGDFRLAPGSPCIDAGNDWLVPAGVWTDLEGRFRFLDDPLTPDTGRSARRWPVVDLGAYEFGSEPPPKVRRD